MKRNMKSSKITDFVKPTVKPELVPVMGRVNKEIADKARPFIKKRNMSWGDFIEASMCKLIDDETQEKKRTG